MAEEEIMPCLPLAAAWIPGSPRWLMHACDEPLDMSPTLWCLQHTQAGRLTDSAHIYANRPFLPSLSFIGFTHP